MRSINKQTDQIKSELKEIVLIKTKPVFRRGLQTPFIKGKDSDYRRFHHFTNPFINNDIPKLTTAPIPANTAVFKISPLLILAKMIVSVPPMVPVFV